MIAVFNQQVAAFAPWASERGEERSSGAVDRFIDRDPAHISWTVNLKEDLRKSKLATSHPNKMVRSMLQSSSEKGTGTMAEKGTTSLG
jgi:hypothetical protein